MNSSIQPSAAAPAQTEVRTITTREHASLRVIAADYRKSHTDCFPYAAGYVQIFEGKPFGWCSTLNQPRNVVPGAFVVAADGAIHVATGGNEIEGAKAFTPVTVV